MELRLQQIQYVEGYILACNDVLRDLGEVAPDQLALSDAEWLMVMRIRSKVTDSLRQARSSLRLWKGLDTDEQASTDPTPH